MLSANFKHNNVRLIACLVLAMLLSYTYTSIALDTRLLTQVYRPSQIELSSPGIQKSSRGLIQGLIFFCPALPSSWSCPGEKNGEYLQTNCKKWRKWTYSCLIPTKIALKTLFKLWNIHFLTPSISIQNGVSVKLSNSITSLRALADTVYSGWDQGWDQKTHVIIYMSHVSRDVIKFLSFEISTYPFKF